MIFLDSIRFGGTAYQPGVVVYDSISKPTIFCPISGLFFKSPPCGHIPAYGYCPVSTKIYVVDQKQI